MLQCSARDPHTESLRLGADATRSAHVVVGVDVGVKADSLLVIATPDSVEVDCIQSPKSLQAAQSRLRGLQRRAARQHGPYDRQTRTRQQPSKRWRATQARIGRTHAHAAAVIRSPKGNGRRYLLTCLGRRCSINWSDERQLDIPVVGVVRRHHQSAALGEYFEGGTGHFVFGAR